MRHKRAIRLHLLLSALVHSRCFKEPLHEHNTAIVCLNEDLYRRSMPHMSLVSGEQCEPWTVITLIGIANLYGTAYWCLAIAVVHSVPRTSLVSQSYSSDWGLKSLPCATTRSSSSLHPICANHSCVRICLETVPGAGHNVHIRSLR